MPFEPTRFIHAANLCLDGQLAEIIACPDNLRELIENATTTAFQRVVDASIEHDVDFVLLVGNSFDEAEGSLTARTSLLDGFHRLADQDIRLFVLPGERDPADAWREIPHMPDNVTTFFNRSSEAVAVLRDGKVIASVACVGSGEDGNARGISTVADPTATARREPFRVGLCRLHKELSRLETISLPDEAPSGEEDIARSSRGDAVRLPAFLEQTAFDYLALGGADQRQTITTPSGIAHNPAGTQALAAANTGPHGCTLVEVSADGMIACRFIPTAPVRRENFALGIKPGETPGGLLTRMRDLLDEQKPQPGESLWLVRWTLAGSGSLYKSLCEGESAQRFIDWSADRLRRDSLPTMLHSLRVLPDRAAVKSSCNNHHLAGEYFDALDGFVPLTGEALAECLGDLPGGSDVISDRLGSLIGNVDDRLILGEARQFGIDWFGQLREGAA